MGLLDDLKQNYSAGMIAEETRPECPVCGNLMNNPIRLFTMQSPKEKTLWYHCQCSQPYKGSIIFNPHPSDEHYEDFKKELRSLGWKGRDSREYFVHVYFPLMEELTFGRKIIEVGYCLPYILRKARDRGFICTGMDLHMARSSERGIEIIRDDFETHEFKFRKYDIIIMIHVIEHLKDFRAAIKKIWNILRPEGVVFIASPDAGLYSKTGLVYWGGWDLRCRTMFSMDSFNFLMEQQGFANIMLRRNEGARFGHNNDFHGIWQRPYYDEPYIGGYDMGLDFEKIKEHIKNVQEKKDG